MSVAAQGSTPTLVYRADIDGLRAVSVMLVILFHAHVPGFEGGYIGVDVFFVISGFFITHLLLAPSHATLRARLATFYLRRARRILPALLVMLLVVAIASAVLLLPAELMRFGRSIAFAATMLGNLGTWLGGGYFEMAGPFRPIDHLWSIGVEEQFYLLFPVAVLTLTRYWPAGRAATVAIAGAVSLALCIWASYRFPLANYYLLPTRAWQLALGALIALYDVRSPGPRMVNEALAAASLGTILLAACSYNANTRYPGVLALAPSLAAAALLAAGREQRTIAARLLSLRPCVFTGRISYSLYLWHLPILTLYAYYAIDTPGPAATATLVAVTYVVAALSWAAIEQPVRARTLFQGDRSFIATGVAVTGILVASGLVLWYEGGVPERFDPEVQHLTAGIDVFHPVPPRCQRIPLERVAAGELCSYGPQTAGARSVLVWGDSHAYALLPAYEQLATTHDVRIYYGIMGGCRPVPGRADREDEQHVKLCQQFAAAMLSAVQQLRPDVVILNGYWNLPGADDERIEASGDTAFHRALGETLRNIDAAGSATCAVPTVPEYPYPVPYALAMLERRGLTADFIAMTRAQALGQSRITQTAMHAFEQQGRLRVADPKRVLCSTGNCIVLSPDGTPLYRDRTHLSIAGALFVSTALEKCFGAAR